MAGTLSDMLTTVLPKEFRHVDPTRAQVSLIEMGPAVLGSFSPASQTYAASALKQHGVQLRLGVAVKEVTANEVLLSDGSRVPTGLVIWAAGVKAEAVPTQPAAQRHRAILEAVATPGDAQPPVREPGEPEAVDPGQPVLLPDGPRQAPEPDRWLLRRPRKPESISGLVN